MYKKFVVLIFVTNISNKVIIVRTQSISLSPKSLDEYQM